MRDSSDQISIGINDLLETLSKGLVLLEEEISLLQQRGETLLPGDSVFKLYDTFGFPVDLTADVLRARGMSVDQGGFDRAMSEQRSRARAAWKGSGDEAVSEVYARMGGDLSTSFCGYQGLEGESLVTGLLVGGAPAERAERGDGVEIVVEETPFYAESGGQVGDVGVISTAGGRIEVEGPRPAVDVVTEAVLDALRTSPATIRMYRVPPGEAAKTMAVIEDTCRRILADGFERGDRVLGLGGGAATDVAGFVAAILLRGVSFGTLSTTLLGQVDASVGGKTGVNLPEGKNLVGAFHQPTVVACDPAFLETLPAREFRAGLAEVVKTAWIGDPGLFAALEDDPPGEWSHPGLSDVVKRCVEIKADIVARDEREGGLRACLNFGHTLGHALETESGGRLLHGEAVALGLVAAVHLSVGTGRCDAALLDRLVALLERLGLPTREDAIDPEAAIARTRADKKRAGGRDSWQLTRGLGLVSVARDLPEGASCAALEFLRR